MTSEFPAVSDSADARAPLVCRKCKGALRWSGDLACCDACSLQMQFVQGVAVAMDRSHHSSFDSMYEVMQKANKEPGTWELFYRAQTALVANALRGGGVVVDVGCGPELPYDKGRAFVIGVDASFASVQANSGADLRIFGSSSEMPLRDACADVVLCLYSIHHMTGPDVRSNREAVRGAFREFGRVLKADGRLLVFEASPYWPFALAQRMFWNVAKSTLGEPFDMHFWTAAELERVGRETLGGEMTARRFLGGWARSFPPVFSKPMIRIPRVLYPFHICLYEWRKPAGR